MDTEVDKRLDAIGTDEATALKGKAAVANARLAYAAFEEVFAGDRWEQLAQAGAHRQRPLWASTGVKNPDYPDTLYVSELVVADTVNTMPEKTMEAFADHGEVTGDTVTGRDDDAQQVFDRLEAVGIDFDDVLQVLEHEGVDKFKKSWTELRRDGPRPDGEGRQGPGMSDPAGAPSRSRDGAAFELFFGYPDEAAYAAVVEGLVADRVASGIAAQDGTLWGPDAESEASKRLSWVALPEASRELVTEIAALRGRAAPAGRHRIVLCGMGGSSLAPEVICGAAGVELDVLDSSDPDFVRTALEDRLADTAIVVSSKSGGTVETDSQRRAFEKAFTDAGINPAERIIVVTDPGLPARGVGARRRLPRLPRRPRRRRPLLRADRLRAGAQRAGRRRRRRAARRRRRRSGRPSRPTPPTTPGCASARLLGAANLAGVDKLVLADAGSAVRRLRRLGRAARRRVHRQGRQGHPAGRGRRHRTPRTSSPARPTRCWRRSARSRCSSVGPPASRWGASVNASLGAQLLLWEYATAVAGRVIGINPFDQPDVESAKQAARDMLDGGGSSPTPVVRRRPGHGLRLRGLAARGHGDGPRRGRRAARASWTPTTATSPSRPTSTGTATPRWPGSATPSPRRTGRPVTFGWGPRFLHSTGQYHKGGPATGVYLQVTGQPEADLAVPDRPFTFQEFLTAQAVGDGQVLADKGRPVLRLHVSGPGDLTAVREVLS